MQASHLEAVAPGRATTLGYMSASIASFHVLADESTILGIDFRSKSAVFRESLEADAAPSVLYSSDTMKISKLAVDARSNSFVLGETAGASDRLVHCDLTTGRVLGWYRTCYLSTVSVGRLCGNLLFVSSFGCNTIVIVDIAARNILFETVTTAIGNAVCLQVCPVEAGESETKYALAVTGFEPDYSDGKSDLFDVSGLIRQYSLKPKKPVGSGNA